MFYFIRYGKNVKVHSSSGFMISAKDWVSIAVLVGGCSYEMTSRS